MLATASRPRAIGINHITRSSAPSRRNRSASPVAPRISDEPVGALRDADLRLHPDRLGARPGVGRDRSHREAVDRERRHPAVVARADVVHREAPEDRRVADPVERRVQESAERRHLTAGARHVAVDHVAEDEHGDEQNAGEEPPLREEHERAGADPQGAHDGHRVGTHPQAQEEVTDRRPDVGPELAEAFEHGRSRLAARAPQPPFPLARHG